MVETSVILLNYNGKRYLEGCIDSLLLQSYQDFEIILLDNASSDDSVEFVEKRYAQAIASKKLRLIRNKKNIGFAGGNNLCYSRVAASVRYVVLVNTDVIARKTWLEKLLIPLRQNPSVGLVGTIDDIVGDTQFRNHFVKNDYSLTMTLSGEGILVDGRRHLDDGLVSAFCVSGNGVAIRHSVIKKPFDDDYFAYAEDTYLSWLAQLRGVGVVYAFDARLLHFGGGTKKGTSAKFNRLLDFHGSKNQVMNYLLFYEWKNIIRIAPIFALTQVGHVIHNPKKFPNKIRAYWWILAHLRIILRKRKAIQAQRKCPDKEILPMLSGKYFDEHGAKDRYNKTYQFAIRVLNKLSLLYCRIVFLNVFELKKKK